ncbi:MAG: NADPH-dependent F420 reductase [Sulfobacillus sp.]
MTKKRIGIIGNGHVGSALARGLKTAGHDVKAIGNEQVRETALWAEIAILAVPFQAIDSVLKEADSSFDGKTLVDVTNALGVGMQWAIGFTTSGAEELQKKAPKARVVKAFNTIFAQHMETGRLGDQQLTAFVAGDDAGAKNACSNSRAASALMRLMLAHSRTHACWSLLDTSIFNLAMGWEWVRK